MAEVTRCVLDKNSQTSKADTKLKSLHTVWEIYPVWSAVEGEALQTVTYAFAIKIADRNQKQR